MKFQQFMERSHLDAPTLNAWVEAEWLMPMPGGTAYRFSDADLARSRLILDLKNDFGVNDDGITIVLHLLDQVHGLRALLKDIAAEMSEGAGGVT